MGMVTSMKEETNHPSQDSEKEDLSYLEHGYLANTFAMAYVELGKGRAVKLPEWIGYWVLNKNHCIEMHLGDGTVEVLTEGQIPLSLHLATREGWYVLSKKDIAAYDSVHQMIRESMKHE